MGTRIANPYGYERAFKHSLDATNGDWLFDSTVTPAESRKSSGTRMVLDPSTARGVNGGANWGEWAPVGTSAAVPRSILHDDKFSEPLGRFGKKASGRTLDGETWDDAPLQESHLDALAG